MGSHIIGAHLGKLCYPYPMLTARSHYRRYAGYDYSRGASLFITVSTEPRRRLFGEISTSNRVVLSSLGAIAEQELLSAIAHFPEISIVKHVVMPDHAHFRIVLKPNVPEPVKQIGAFVGRFKQLSQWRIGQAGGPAHLWEKGYHDHLCLSRDMNRAVDRYIENNPLKWRLMHGDRSLMPIREPLDEPWLPCDTFWRGVGAINPTGNARLIALRISRKVAPAFIDDVVNVCVRGAQRGDVYVSTFFSPGEHAVFRAIAAQTSAPLIHLRHEAIAWSYRPTGDEPELFASKRLIVLARMEADDSPETRADLLWLNAKAREIALAASGKAVYVKGGMGGKPKYEVES